MIITMEIPATATNIIDQLNNSIDHTVLSVDTVDAGLSITVISDDRSSFRSIVAKAYRNRKVA